MFVLGCGACIGNIFVGAIVAVGQIGNLTLLPKLVLASGCIFLAIFGFYRIAKRRRTLHIDISGLGQIRLREQLARQHTQTCDDQVGAKGEVVRLLAGSTLWPYLLLLRLQAEDGRVIVLPILADSMSCVDFRALVTALRWIATRNNLSASKIL